MSLGGKTYGKYESFSKMIAEPGGGGGGGENKGRCFPNNLHKMEGKKRTLRHQIYRGPSIMS